ncbi:serine/threonine-protein kinase [Merismopedia glauca]|uniref:non-specific serine/threonine protein kinase n=1 Tax=Merismopedia glauca CCAP 1448/3 TaxID=1296344 RepID=A0A2T1C9G1_9CYAN|nr:serine/threonine-protein kinase [Merismopedia glauca]PSB04798.1 hypothetical protein C7B64_02240 [Merismopedia glauca CCAP 1448/3]
MNQPPLVGQTLRSHYHIIQSLGSGGFGDTYLAQDLDLPGKPYCVVKHLKPKTNDPAVLPIAKGLFDREAQTLYQLGSNSEQIPRLFAHFEENGEFYLVQEFVDGHDLTREIIPGQIKPEAVTCKLLKDILEVLAVVHQRNVIHRDIKPQNLMRRKSDGKIVLIDFGAVKEIGTLLMNSQGQTSVSVAVGSPGYMPNEQSNGRPKFASDVYAVGMMGIQALTGFLPQQLQEDPETGEILWRDYAQVSDELGEVLDKMVRDHFSQRYQTASAALEALMPIIDPPSLPIPLPTIPSTPPPVFTIPFVSPVTPPTSPPKPSPRTTSRPTRHKFLNLISIIGVVLGGLGIWEVIKRTSTEVSTIGNYSPSTQVSPAESPSPLTTLTTIPNTSNTGNWYSYKSEDGSYSADFPAKPQEQKRNVKSAGKEVNFTLVNYQDQPNKRFYATAVSNIPLPPGTKFDVEKGLDGARDNALKSGNAKLIKETKISLNGYQGRELTMQGEGTLVAKQKMFADAKNFKLYQAILVAEDGNVDFPEGQKFFESFFIK